MAYTSHPNIIAAVSIIRTKPEGHPRSTISSLALFTVTRHGRREARFDLEYHSFDPTYTRAEILDGVTQSISPGADLLIRQTHPSPHSIRQSSRTQLPPTDVQILSRALVGSTILSIHASDKALAAAAASLGTDTPASSPTSIRQRRDAPLHAQVLWVVYTAAFCSPADQRALFAAFQAWWAIDRARIGIR